jgi:hypothetical protein
MRQHGVVITLTLVLLVLLTDAVPARRAHASNPFLGDWKGAISFGGQDVEIALHFAVDSGGKISGTVDAPAQGLKAAPISDLVVEGQAIAFALVMPTSKSLFKGTLDPAGSSIAGTMSLDGMRATFSVTKQPASTASLFLAA